VQADVIVWVSEAEDRFALWIYDVASDHASARALAESPPFEATTAAAVALAIKALLRTTAVAPPPERFGARESFRASEWLVGVDLGAAVRFGEIVSVEGRAGLTGAFWPRNFGPWGLSLRIDSGAGVPMSTSVFVGTYRDSGLHLAAGARIPLANFIELESFLGGGVHLVTIDGFLSEGTANHVPVSSVRVDGAVESRLGFAFRFLDARMILEPWFGVTVLTHWQGYFVRGGPQVLDLNPVSPEGALRLAFTWP
jgi:hypothetical protein